MKREVLEEAGLECEPDALISVEYSSRSWVRFTFTGMFSQKQLVTTTCTCCSPHPSYNFNNCVFNYIMLIALPGQLLCVPCRTYNWWGFEDTR